MTTTKAQTETVRGPEIEKSRLSTETIWNQPENFDLSTLAGLMLGMQLRKGLSERDRILLDKLAPPDRSVFLVNCDRFVHPEQFDTFPLDVIGGGAGEQAFFSHRFCPGGELSGQATAIQTAVLNPGDPNPLLFGWFGPEMTSLDGYLDHRFSRLVVDLRRAWSESAAMAHRLKAQLQTEAPTLVIDRLSGRLLWLNKPAANLCGQERSALVDLRFEQVRNMLSRTLTRRRLTMKRVCVEDIEVTIVTLPEVKMSTPSTNRFVTDSLVQLSQKKLAGIIMAADLLKSSLSDQGESEGAELSEIISGEARALDDLISRQILPQTNTADDSTICTQMRSTPPKILETQ